MNRWTNLAGRIEPQTNRCLSASFYLQIRCTGVFLQDTRLHTDRDGGVLVGTELLTAVVADVLPSGCRISFLP